MEHEIIKYPILVFNTNSVEKNEDMVDYTIIVPDKQPDVSKIITTNSDLMIHSRTLTNKAMEIKGSICYTILYKTDADEKLYSIRSENSFLLKAKVPSNNEDIIDILDIMVEYSEAEVINGRKIAIKSVIK